MVRESATATLTRDLPQLAESPDTARRLAPSRAGASAASSCSCTRGRGCRDAEFAPATRALVASDRTGVVHDSRGELKVVGVVEAPRLGGRLVGVIFLTDAYGPLQSAARLLAWPPARDGRHRRHAGLRQPRVDPGGARPVVRGAPRGGRARSTRGCSVWRRVTRSASCRRWWSATSGSRATFARPSRRRCATRPAAGDAAPHRPGHPGCRIGRSHRAGALPRLRRSCPALGRRLVFEPELTGPGSWSSTAWAARRGAGQTVGDAGALADHARCGRRAAGGGRPADRRARASRAPRRQFDATTPRSSGEVANQLAVAIHQATLREALDQQQRRLQELVEHLPEGVLLVERDGRIALANPVRARPPGRRGVAVAPRSRHRRSATCR